MTGCGQQALIARQLVRTFGWAPDPRRRVRAVISELRRADDWSAAGLQSLEAAYARLRTLPLFRPWSRAGAIFLVAWGRPDQALHSLGSGDSSVLRRNSTGPLRQEITAARPPSLASARHSTREAARQQFPATGLPTPRAHAVFR